MCSVQVLHTFVFVGLPLLTHLNLSHNQVDILIFILETFFLFSNIYNKRQINGAGIVDAESYADHLLSRTNRL